MATPTAAAEGEAARAADPFHYEDAALRLTGVVLAAAMFLLGLLIAISKKFKCKKAESSPPDPPVKTPTPAATA